MTHATSRLVQNKNRYSNILPFDYNLIQLKHTLIPDAAISGNDYINASKIESLYDLDRHYIATQGPLQSTVADFWQMILEQKSRVIVSLTPEIESGREKCARYWPVDNEVVRIPITASQRTASFHQTGGFSIRLMNIEPETTAANVDCVIREIQVAVVSKQSKNAQEVVWASSNVCHLLFLEWADHGVPQETSKVVALIRLANQCQPKNAGPMVVHCSAGCGRTGTFCVIDSGLEWLKQCAAASEVMSVQSQQSDTSELSELTDQDVDPVFELTDYFRTQRTTMVQTRDQYLFCYQALWEVMQKEYNERSCL
ncbi:protein-tyrosine phosphatase-like protein [Spinellus fusiger]|nr:protein-tyrosine phosphatase-like protein [Spinellus fusiger]